MYKVVLITFALMIAGCSESKQKSERLIRKCFEEYKTANINDDGEKVVALVSENTFEFYDEMLSMALYTDSATLTTASLVYKLLILEIRR